MPDESIYYYYLGQNISDVTYVICIYCIVCFLITNLSFYINYFYNICYFDIMLVLFQLPGANYFTNYLLFFLTYIIATLNVTTFSQ